MVLVEGFVAPFAAIASPGKLFEKLREHIDSLGSWSLIPLWFSASLAAVMASFFSTYLLLVLVNIASRNLAGIFSSMLFGAFTAFYYSVMIPLVFGILDPLVSLIVLLPAPRERPAYYVFAARAGSILPYALKPPLLVLQSNSLTLPEILLPKTTISALVTAIGLLLTGYGIKKMLKTSLLWGLLASLTPLLLRITAGILLSLL